MSDINKNITDENLLSAIRNGDSTAWRELYKNNRQMIFSLIRKNSGTDDDAADILQEAMCVLNDKIKEPTFQLTASLSTFLYGICRNLWLMKLRKAVTEQRIKDTIKFTGDSVQTEVDEEKETLLTNIEKSLTKLGETCRKIIAMYYYDKKSMEEIAVIVGMKNSDTVKAQKYRCLQQLKSSI